MPRTSYINEEIDLGSLSFQKAGEIEVALIDAAEKGGGNIVVYALLELIEGITGIAVSVPDEVTGHVR